MATNLDGFKTELNKSMEDNKLMEDESIATIYDGYALSQGSEAMDL